MDVNIGSGLFISRCKGRRIFGTKLTIYNNVIFEIHDSEAVLSIGDNCTISYGCVFVCTHEIVIGNNVWIGEYSSIRDSTHEFSIHEPLGAIPDKLAPIKIGNNVWIGRGCLILPGSVIGDNVTIGANSVVKGEVSKNSLYAGAPAIFKRLLN
jgi:maltose O-acetyltransferase